MKHLALILCLLLAGCATSTGPVITDIALTYGVAKVIENSSASARPSRVQMLRDTAEGLRALAKGTVSRQAVDALLSKSLTGADLAAVRALIMAYFPDDGDVPVHHNPALAAAALRVAGLIEAGLPSESAK